MIKKGKKLSMMLLTAMILAAGSVGTVAGTGAKQADTVLVPIQCEYYALEGLSQLIHTINLVQDRLNPDLEIEGVHCKTDAGYHG